MLPTSPRVSPGVHAVSRADLGQAYVMSNFFIRRLADSPAGRFVALLSALVVSGVAVYLFAAHMRQGAITSDWPWLWRTGQWIRAHGLPSTDLYSWSLPDQGWLLYQWLFEVLASALYDAIGRTGSVIFLCIATVAGYVVIPAWFNARRGVPLMWGLTLASLALLPVSINLGLRPMLATSLALLAQFLWVHRLRRATIGRWPAVIGLAALYALWANMHLGLTLGLLSLMLFAIGDVVDRYRGIGRTLPVRDYALLGGTAVLASLANPYGWRIYPYIVDLSLKRDMNAHIHELMPPSPDNPYVMIGILLLAVFLGQWLIRRRSIGFGEGLHVLIFCLGTALSLRFVVWAGLFYALVAPALWRSAPAPATTPNSTATPRQRNRQWSIVYSVVALCCLLSAFQKGPAAPGKCAPLAAGIRYLDHHYPPRVHWFSSETVGSCTRLYAPQRSVFIDTRFDMYPQRYVMRWFEAYQHRSDWQALFQRWHIQLVLLPRGAPLAPVLANDANFHRVWHDHQTELFERRPPPLASDR